MPPLRKRIKRTLRYLALRAVAAIVGVLPPRVARALGRGLGALAFTLARRHREQALDSVALAFFDRDDVWRTRVAKDSFRHLGECAFELAAHRWIDPVIDRYVEIPDADRQVLDAAIGRGRGVVVVSGHVGNFELLARRVAMSGYSCATIARETSDPRTTALIERFRDTGWLATIWRGTDGAARAMLRQLRRGGILGMLIDQDTDVQGVFVDFFGRPAFTPRAAADLALHTGAAVLISFIHRRSDGGHAISIREVDPPSTGDRERDAREWTQTLTRAIEAEIRRVPQEWVWIHKRWKTRPPTTLPGTALAGPQPR